MQYLLIHYGYAFLVLGLIIEGDATLVAAAILAGQGYLDMRWVIGLALGVTIAGNEMLYEIGNMGRLRGLARNGSQRQRVSRWLHNSGTGFMVLMFSRFMWGFRLMIPLAAGFLHIKRRRFVLHNLIGGVIWVAVLAYFGVAIQTLIAHLHDDLVHYQSHIAVGLFLLGILIGLGSIPWQITRRSLRRRVALSLRSDEKKHGAGTAVRRA